MEKIGLEATLKMESFRQAVGEYVQKVGQMVSGTTQAAASVTKGFTEVGQAASLPVAAIQKLEKAIERTETQIGSLAPAIDLQKRALVGLEGELFKVSEKYGFASEQAQKKELALDRLRNSIANNERRLAGYQSALSDLGEELRETANATEDLEEESEGLTHTLPKTAMVTERASTSIVRLGDVSSNAKISIGTLQATVAGLAAGIGVALVDALVKATGQLIGLATGGLKTNSSLEITEARILAMTKSTAETAQIMGFLREEVAKTPFALDELAAATASLIPVAKATGVPLKDLIATAEVLAASNPAQGLDGAVTSLREAQSDFVSIADRFDLPRQRLNELKAQGIPAMQAVNIALAELGLTADLVTGLAATGAGRLSTFQDTLVEIRATASQPLFELLKESLADVQILFDENRTAILAWATDTGQSIAEFAKSIFEAGRLLATGDFRGGIFGLQEDDPAINALFMVREAVLGVAEAAGRMQAVSQAAGGGLLGFLAGAGVDPALGASILYLRDRVVELAGELRSNLQPVFAAIQQALGGVLLSFQNFGAGALTEILNFVRTGEGEFTNFKALLSGVGESANRLLMDLAAYAVANLPAWQNALAEFGKEAWLWIERALPVVQAWLFTLTGNLVQWLADNFPQWTRELARFGTAAATWLSDAIPETIKAASDWLASLVRWSSSPEATGQLDSIWANFRETALPALLELDRAIKTLLADIGFAVLQGGISLGGALIDGIIQGFTGKRSDLGQAFADGINAMIEGGRLAAEARSPSRKSARLVGLPLGEGVAAGVLEALPAIRQAASAAVGAAIPNVQQPMIRAPMTTPSPVMVSGPSFANSFGDIVLQGAPNSPQDARNLARQGAGQIESILVDTLMAAATRQRGSFRKNPGVRT